MKKLKLQALELGATEVLTSAQLKNVLGGDGSTGTCCAHSSGWDGWQCGLSKTMAQDFQENGGWDNWCCDSCQSSWNSAHPNCAYLSTGCL
ncbi:hypothetical protein [Chitinophaga lutea]|uniref:hypothetical protein n=1 Tax=Chitinophaga lutea TaxID=2488634 RepID=UPI000F4FA8B2|nr:hypothetical protein [Chitinophaga lutea]